MKEILITGSGAMAQSMGEGLRAEGYSVRYVVRDLSRTHGASGCISYEQADFAGRAVILATKAPGYAAVKNRLKDAAVVLSAAAAISAHELAECGAPYIARIMPNIAARYGASATTLYVVKDSSESDFTQLARDDFGGGARASSVDRTPSSSSCEPLAPSSKAHAIAREIVEGFGSCVEVASEEQLIAAMGINGCSPAWLALVADGLAIGAASGGLPHAEARALAAASIKSAALLLEQMGPEALITGVCSPGGVTLKGLNVLEAAGVRSAFAQAVIAAK